MPSSSPSSPSPLEVEVESGGSADAAGRWLGGLGRERGGTAVFRERWAGRLRSLRLPPLPPLPRRIVGRGPHEPVPTCDDLDGDGGGRDDDGGDGDAGPTTTTTTTGALGDPSKPLAAAWSHDEGGEDEALVARNFGDDVVRTREPVRRTQPSRLRSAKVWTVALSCVSSTLSAVVTLLVAFAVVLEVTGRALFPCLPLFLWGTVVDVTSALCASGLISRLSTGGGGAAKMGGGKRMGRRRVGPPRSPVGVLIALIVVSAMDAAIHIRLIPGLYHRAVDDFFTELDGTPTIEWEYLRRRTHLVAITSLSAGVVRSIAVACAIWTLCIALRMPLDDDFDGGECGDDAVAGEDRESLLSSPNDEPTDTDTAAAAAGPGPVDPDHHGIDRPPHPTRSAPMHAACTKCISDPNSKCPTYLLRLTCLLAVLSLYLTALSLTSFLAHVVPWDYDDATTHSFRRSGELCDDLDTTECLLPFPSMEYLVEDDTTDTGYRVNLSGEAFFPLKGMMRNRIDPTFLNAMDGFSTSAPMLFYLEGMKEGGGRGLSRRQPQSRAVETVDATGGTNGTSAGVGSAAKMEEGEEGGGEGEVVTMGLPPPTDIGLSITSRSITLLIDVERQELVPHFAEIDHLDERRPLVIVQPANLLRHDAHYAVAVLDAVGGDGQMRLDPSPGLLSVLGYGLGSSREELEGVAAMRRRKRAVRYREVLLPALGRAAPWYPHDDEDTSAPGDGGIGDDDRPVLQLLFDFRTASASSQLGTVRAVRDETFRRVAGLGDGGHWSERVNIHTMRIEEGTCGTRGRQYLARTVHAEMDVPWYLDALYGLEHSRAAMIDVSSLHPRASRSSSSLSKERTGVAKFVVLIPCSVATGELPVRAVMDFGHGLFGTRSEAVHARFLHRMADENGYLIVATDWRGMSHYDLPIVVRALMSSPSLFESIRDNLIQGYSNKIALQHFAKNNLLEMSWLGFDKWTRRRVQTPTNATTPSPAMIFYGISQGGILGSGYTALLGGGGNGGYGANDNNVLDRSILGVPGTPFALILSRSHDFIVYNRLMLLNFYNNRHVRIILSIFQMAWDSIGASGHLAPSSPPVGVDKGEGDDVVLPRVLLQAGLGDTEVPTVAAELLARAYGASVLLGNPRGVFGLEVVPGANSTRDGPRSALTEMLYEDDERLLPTVNTPPPRNPVHLCVRLESNLQRQIVEFINNGRIIDPCTDNGCKRRRATC